MLKYFTLPGYENSDTEHWQSYFERQLQNCSRIEQMSWTDPVLDDWIERIETALCKENMNDTVVITHSLGGIAFMHWFEKYKKTVKAAFIVAPPDIDLIEVPPLSRFAPIPLLHLPFPSMVVASRTDKWATPERAAFFAKNWGSEILFLEDAGHINSSAGYGNWDKGLQLLNNFIVKIGTHDS